MHESHRALKSDDWVLCFYLAGLAVECILQAIALRQGASHDARHDLSRWLARCPADLQATLASSEMRVDWSLLCSRWSNTIRYYSDDGLLWHCRQYRMLHGWLGDNQARMKRATAEFQVSAERVQQKGLARWLAFDKK
jgi:hypothetical protein